MPSLFVQNVPPALFARLERLAASTDGGKRAVVLEALDAYLNPDRNEERRAVDGDLRAAALMARRLLPEPAVATPRDIASAVRLVLDALCFDSAAAGKELAIDSVATARDARRLAVRVLTEEAAERAANAATFSSANPRELAIWARAWLTTAISICVEEHRFDWRSVLDRVEAGAALDKELEVGQFSRLADDWKLTMFEAIPEHNRHDVLVAIRSALLPLTEAASK